MRKINMLIIFVLSLLAFVSCKYNENTNTEEAITDPIVDPNDEEDIHTPVIENYEFTTPKIDGEVTIPKSTLKLEKASFNTYVKNDNPIEGETFCPSIGKPKVLVVPINLDTTKCTNAVLREIRTAYLGSEKETGWESLKTYYNKASYGKLDFDITVTGWYTPSNSLFYYSRSSSYAILSLAKEVLEFYDKKYDYNDFDYDKDGFIDGLELVYNCSTDFSGSSSNFWAFTSDVLYGEEEVSYDGVKPGKFVWSGIDFFHNENDYASYDTSDILVDTHAIIHETGHMLGLDDYYDYDTKTGAKGGLYGADVMDKNMGEHSPFSKMLLGWVEPIIVTGYGDLTFDLESYSKTGDFIIISNHELTSVYDEFLIIEFYTEDGLNSHDKPIRSKNDDKVSGIRITHVDSSYNYNSDGVVVPNENTRFKTAYKYDNSITEYKYINCLVKKKSPSIMTSDNLFTDGDYFGIDYYNNYTFHTGNLIDFTIKVNSITDVANITIDKSWGE